MSSWTDKPPLTGLIAAAHTPMREDGSVHYEAIDRQVSMYRCNPIDGAFVCGTTGEGKSLTLQERMAAAERWMLAAGDRLPVVVHVGDDCLADCQTLARHAEEIGAYGIAAMGPSFFKPTGVEELVSFCSAIASSAPSLPFYYYHIPSLTGVNFLMHAFLNRAKDRIPNLAGVKFTSENLMDFGQSLTCEDSRFNMLFGRDEILLSGLALGARGAIGSTYNYAAPLYRKLWDDFLRGDLAAAQAGQARARALVSIIHKYGDPVTGKAIMKWIGIDCGPVRLPLRNLTPAQWDELDADLQAIRFSDFANQLNA